MKTKNTFFIIALVVFLSLPTVAQKRYLHGIVTTFDSIPLINASIVIKSTKEHVLTDTTGGFKILCNTNDKLKVSANGFYKQNVKIDENIKLVMINLKLRPTEEAKEIAIGYGHVKDADKLSAVAAIKGKDMNFSMYKDVFEILRGRFAGVSVQGDDIIIRGKSSFLGSSAALIIIDGIEVSSTGLRSIAPSNIKSINILKDGSAAIYGVRGANGVVIIETK